MKSPADGNIDIKSLGLSARNLTTEVKQVSVLGYDINASFNMGDDALRVNLNEPIETEFPICLKIEVY